MNRHREVRMNRHREVTDEQRMREVDPSIAFEMDLLFNRLMESMSESEREKYKKGPYACFIDFQKAYDTVPHQALLHKLRAYGITGRVYHFIETLYSHSTMQVRINGVYSREFPLQRGLRQGCPLSPILFSLFINDILPEAPCRPDRWWPKVDCLLYADDVCLFAPSELQLRSLMAQVSEWADTWEMTIGQSKCGVMKFTPKGKEELERRIRATGEKWLLQGKEISPVEEYKYLGLVITQDLNLRRMVEARVQVASTKLNFMARFLTNFCIPAPIRVHVLKAVFMPLLSYGAEVWAVSREERRPRGEHSVQGDELHHPVVLQAEDGQVRCLLGVGHRPPSHATDEEETVGCLQGEGDVCGTRSPDEHGTLLQHDPDSDPEDDTDPGEHPVDEEAQQGRASTRITSTDCSSPCGMTSATATVRKDTTSRRTAPMSSNSA